MYNKQMFHTVINWSPPPPSFFVDVLKRQRQVFKQMMEYSQQQIRNV